LLDEKSRLPTIIKNVIVFVLGIIIIISIYHYLEIESQNPLPFFVISSDTMLPTLKINDLIIIGDGHAFNSTKVGDIIVFKKPAGEDRIIVHRVAEITSENGKRVLITKGDSSSVSIPGVDFPINYNNFIGRVKFVIPQMGILLIPPVNYVLLGAILSAVGIVIFLHGRRRTLQQ
jgi:signal peptidase I